MPTDPLGEARPQTLYDLIERYLIDHGWAALVADDGEVYWAQGGDREDAMDFFDAVDTQQGIDERASQAEAQP